MRRLIIPLLWTGACLAQRHATAEHMQALADAVGRLEQALAGKDRTVYTGPLDSIEAATTSLRQAIGESSAGEPELWIARLEQATRDLRDPQGNVATDRYDFGRMRSACTACHLQTRTDNEKRGLFPNRGNALFGNIELLAKDGEPRQDKSGTVIFLEGEIASAPPLPRKPTISQKGRRFDPPVLVVTAGTTVRFPNNDIVFHNVFSRSVSNPFDLGTYGKGVERERVLENQGLVKVHCNIHPDMASNVLVLDNAHFAITSESGFWAIPDVPDGEFVLRVWHPFATVESKRIRCEGGTARAVEISVRESRQRLQHTNKHGRKYRTKY